MGDPHPHPVLICSIFPTSTSISTSNIQKEWLSNSILNPKSTFSTMRELQEVLKNQGACVIGEPWLKFTVDFPVTVP